MIYDKKFCAQYICVNNFLLNIFCMISAYFCSFKFIVYYIICSNSYFYGFNNFQQVAMDGQFFYMLDRKKRGAWITWERRLVTISDRLYIVVQIFVVCSSFIKRLSVTPSKLMWGLGLVYTCLPAILKIIISQAVWGAVTFLQQEE